MIGFRIILVGVALCALAGCGQKDCREEGAISGMICDLSIRPVADFSGVYDSVMQICDRIEKSANVTDKASNYKVLATRLANIDFTGLGGNDRTLVFGDYWRSLALVCSRMVADDSLDKESFALILKGWKKCQEMCNLPDEPYGDFGLCFDWLSEQVLRVDLTPKGCDYGELENRIYNQPQRTFIIPTSRRLPCGGTIKELAGSRCFSRKSEKSLFGSQNHCLTIQVEMNC